MHRTCMYCLKKNYKQILGTRSRNCLYPYAYLLVFLSNHSLPLTSRDNPYPDFLIIISLFLCTVLSGIYISLNNLVFLVFELHINRAILYFIFIDVLAFCIMNIPQFINLCCYKQSYICLLVHICKNFSSVFS